MIGTTETLNQTEIIQMEFRAAAVGKPSYGRM
jgi:hypothetical protein